MLCPKNVRRLIAFVGFIMVCVSVSPLHAQQSKEQRKPNVVLIMADDVSWEAFSCYGAEDYDTPNIDALASRGVRFAHCHSTPICTPSRVEIMTGQYKIGRAHV